jgi:hypothetical protein
MSSWTPAELEAIAPAEELEIAPRRRDGALRATTTIWVIRAGDELYVRSWRGPSGSWFRAAQQTHEGHIRAGGVERDVALVEPRADVNDAVDDGYRTKYGRYAAYVEPMLRPQARATTLQLVPRGDFLDGRGEF